MAGKKIKLRHRRLFSESFKKARVKEYEHGEYTVSELSRLYSIQEAVIYRWIHKYSSYNRKNVILVEMKDSSTKKLKDYEDRIAQLERALGQKQLQVDFLEKMIDLAEEAHNISIKKNSNTPQSIGFGKTSKK